MFARSVTVHLKSNVQNDFNKTMESNILPILKKQAGFRDLIALVSENGNEVTSISLWDNRESAENYRNTGYNEVLSKLQNYIEDAPTVRVFNVATSTVHNISTGKAA